MASLQYQLDALAHYSVSYVAALVRLATSPLHVPHTARSPFLGAPLLTPTAGAAPLLPSAPRSLYELLLRIANTVVRVHALLGAAHVRVQFGIPHLQALCRTRAD